MIRKTSEATADFSVQPRRLQDENQDFYAYIYAQGPKLTLVKLQMQMEST